MSSTLSTFFWCLHSRWQSGVSVQYVLSGGKSYIANNKQMIKHIQDNGPELDEALRVGDQAEALASSKRHSDPRRRYLSYVSISDSTLARLLEEANAAGIRPNDFAGVVLDEIMPAWKPPSETDTGIARYVMWKVLQIESLANLYEQAYHAAAVYHKHPIPQAAEALYDLCERLDVNPEELLERVRSDPFMEIAASSLPDRLTKHDRCKRWLLEQMSDVEQIAATEIYARGVRAGYNEQMLRNIARSVGITSSKSGGHYIWRRPSGPIHDDADDDYDTTTT